MKRVVTLFALVLAMGCSTVQQMESGDRLKVAALQSIGLERVAWLSNNKSALPASIADAVVDLKTYRGFVDSVDANNGTATVTYWYTGTFTTPQGQREGTLTVQRRLHFTRTDSGAWTANGQTEEIARNSTWSTVKATS